MKSTICIQTIPRPAPRVPMQDWAGDLRARLGWRALLGFTLDAVLAAPMEPSPQSSRSAVLLTLVSYCYASGILGSQDIEMATGEQAEIAYITRGMAITAADIRQFRRANRQRIERCLEDLLILIAKAHPDVSGEESGQIGHAARSVARHWVSLAVQFDTMFSE